MSCDSEGKIDNTVDSFITNYKMSTIVYNTSAAFVTVYKVKTRSVNSSIYYQPAQKRNRLLACRGRDLTGVLRFFLRVGDYSAFVHLKEKPYCKQAREIKVIRLESEFCNSHIRQFILFYYNSSLEYNVAH